MKTSTKCVLGVLSAIAVAGIGGYVYTQIRKERKLILEKEKSKEAEIEKLGLNVQKVKEEFLQGIDDQNLVKELYHGVRFNGLWDLDVIHEAYNSDHPVYVMQSEYKGVRSLDLYFEIPEIRENDDPDQQDNRNGKKYKRSNLNPQIRDYINALNDVAESVFEHIKFVDRPYTELTSKVVLRFAEEPEGKLDHFVTLPVPRELYENLEGGDLKRGLTTFVMNYKRGIKDDVNNLKHYISILSKEKGWYEVEIADVALLYRMSFSMADIKTKGISTNFGINYKLGIDALQYIVDNAVVYYNYHEADKGTSAFDEKCKVSRIIKYNHLIFNAPDQHGNWEMILVYDTENGHIVSDFLYDIDLDEED